MFQRDEGAGIVRVVKLKADGILGKALEEAPPKVGQGHAMRDDGDRCWFVFLFGDENSDEVVVNKLVDSGIQCVLGLDVLELRVVEMLSAMLRFARLCCASRAGEERLAFIESEVLLPQGDELDDRKIIVGVLVRRILSCLDCTGCAVCSL